MRCFRCTAIFIGAAVLSLNPWSVSRAAEISPTFASGITLYAASRPAHYRELGLVSAKYDGASCSRSDGLVGGVIDVLLKVQPQDGCASGSNEIHWSRVAPKVLQQLRENAAALGADAVIDVKAYTTRDCKNSIALGSDEQEHAWVEGIAVKTAPSGHLRR